jgi:hypothetical protein
MARGGLLVKVHDAPGLTLDSPVDLELVLPDGTTLQSACRVLQVFAGFGVAVSVPPPLVEQASQCASRPEVATTGSARHEWIDRVPARRGTQTRPPPATTPPPLRPAPAATPPLARSRPSATPPPLAAAAPSVTTQPATPPIAPGSSGPAKLESSSRSEKIQKALHGTRDERNAILRDRDRTLHPFVLKNPQLDADDVLAIAKNAQMTSDLLKQIGERRDWLQRPAIALALARNPRTPPELAMRALDHVPLDALRQIAKGGVLPHVTQAARKKLLG